MKNIRTVAATLIVSGIIWMVSMEAAGQSPDKTQIKPKPIDPSMKSQQLNIPKIEIKKNEEYPKPGEIWLYAALIDGTLERRAYNFLVPDANVRGPYFEGKPGWNEFKHLFSLNGKLYGIYQDGKLVWYSGQGIAEDGGFSYWEGPHPGITVSDRFHNVFPMGPYPRRSQSLGVIYAIDENGDVLWYRHTAEPNNAWEGPFTVKTGWKNQRLVFAGDEGVIYSVDDKGDLYWQKHHDWKDGGQEKGRQVWDEPKKVYENFEQAAMNSNGSVANGRHADEPACKTKKRVDGKANIFGAGDGVIYAVDGCGYLTWFRHVDWQNGGKQWDEPTWFASVFNVHRMFVYIPPPPNR